MKIINGITYIGKKDDWNKLKIGTKVNVNGGLQEGYFSGWAVKKTSIYNAKYPTLVRRERRSIVEDFVGEMPTVHDKGLSGKYNRLDKFLRRYEKK